MGIFLLFMLFTIILFLFRLELIAAYCRLCIVINTSGSFFASFYEDDSLPLLAAPESDKWPGELMLQNSNYSQDCLVPDLLIMDNIQDLTERYDNAEPDEELLSILEEIITEDEKKAEGKQTYAISIRVITLTFHCSSVVYTLLIVFKVFSLFFCSIFF